MKMIAEQIRKLISDSKPELLKISKEDARKKEGADIWSKQEIIGHLIDSTSNNHQRFVRGAYNVASDFPAYDQVQWVNIQCYNELNWPQLVELFTSYNLHLCRILDSLPGEVLNNPCNIGKENPVPLQFVIKDYLRHMKHHIARILENPED